MAERIIDRDEEPGIAAFRHDGLGQTGRERITVVNPGCLRRRASLAGKGGASHSAGNDDPVVVSGELLDRKRHSGVVKSYRHIHGSGFEPAARPLPSPITLAAARPPFATTSH